MATGKASGLARAFSLVELLVVVVVLAIIAAVLMPTYLKGSRQKTATGERVIESPMQRGHSVECMNNLSQLRQSYQIATGADDENKPKSLAEFRGIPESMKSCPVGHVAYQFDPATGRIWCPQPGHEKY